jgi:hypothetical protein
MEVSMKKLAVGAVMIELNSIGGGFMYIFDLVLL